MVLIDKSSLAGPFQPGESNFLIDVSQGSLIKSRKMLLLTTAQS
jgi:hypothetical protein